MISFSLWSIKVLTIENCCEFVKYLGIAYYVCTPTCFILDGKKVKLWLCELPVALSCVGYLWLLCDFTLRLRSLQLVQCINSNACIIFYNWSVFFLKVSSL